MTAVRVVASRLISGVGFALLILAFMFLLLGDPARAQTTKPAPKPKPATEQPESTTQGQVYYPDLCNIAEEGSWSWYFMGCFLK